MKLIKSFVSLKKGKTRNKLFNSVLKHGVRSTLLSNFQNRKHYHVLLAGLEYEVLAAEWNGFSAKFDSSLLSSGFKAKPKTLVTMTIHALFAVNSGFQNS